MYVEISKIGDVVIRYKIWVDDSGGEAHIEDLPDNLRNYFSQGIEDQADLSADLLYPRDGEKFLLAIPRALRTGYYLASDVKEGRP